MYRLRIQTLCRFLGRIDLVSVVSPCKSRTSRTLVDTPFLGPSTVELGRNTLSRTISVSGNKENKKLRHTSESVVMDERETCNEPIKMIKMR